MPDQPAIELILQGYRLQSDQGSPAFCGVTLIRSSGTILVDVAHTGRLVFVGIVVNDITFADPLLHRREMTLFASRNALPADFTRIIRLIEEGTIDTRPWITHRTSFAELIGNFPSYTKPETGVIKAMVEVE